MSEPTDESNNSSQLGRNEQDLEFFINRIVSLLIGVCEFISGKG